MATMIEKLKESRGAAFGFKVVGRISGDEVKAFEPQIEFLIKERKERPIGILADLSQMEGADWKARWNEMRFLQKYTDHIARMAVRICASEPPRSAYVGGAREVSHPAAQENQRGGRISPKRSGTRENARWPASAVADGSRANLKLWPGTDCRRGGPEVGFGEIAVDLLEARFRSADN